MAKETLLGRVPYDPTNENYKHSFTDEGNVAKLTATFGGDKREQSLLNKATIQSIHSLLYNRPKQYIKDSPAKQNVRITTSYPVIIVDSLSKFYEYDVQTDKIQNLTESFQLEIYYVYRDNKSDESRKEYFLVDVCGIDTFEKYVEKLEKNDFETIKKSASIKY